MQRALGCVVLVLGGLVAGCTGDDVNHLAPETGLDEVPAAISRETHVRITFHANGNANNFVCQLDGATPTTCISPFETTVPEGMHTFAVAAALNSAIDETPALHTWRVDATVPDTTLVMGPPSPDNTVDPQLTFTGSDPGGGAVTFECKLDAGAFAACTSPHPVSVTDGAHAFEVRAVDVAGNVDPSPATHAWTVDTSAPDTTITSGPADGSVSQASIAFAFTSPDGTATFECSLDAATFTACTSPKAYPSLADGSHTFTVRAKNAIGTLDPTPPSRTWTVDGTAPTVTITTTPTNPSNDSTPTFAFISPDATATFACQFDGGAFAACSSAFTGPTLADGSHTFHVQATDPAGNTGAEATHTWTIDTTAPTVTITSGPSGAVATAIAVFTFTTAGAPTATECSLDAGAFVACSASVTYTALADSAHTFTVRVTDAAGNTGMATRSFTVDTTPPVVTITSGPTNPTSDSTPTFTFTVTGATTIACSVDGGAFVACTSPFTTATLADGSHTVVVRGTDAVGNGATASQTFVVDTTAPTVTITSGPSGAVASATAVFTFTTAGAPTATECSLDASAFVACSASITYAALADGAHTFTVRVTDAAGNTGMATRSFTVDTTPPVVTITSGPTNPTSDSTPTFTFTVTGATSITCSVDGSAFTTCTSPFTTATLADGSHTVVIRGTDAVGNSGTASQTFVVDTTAPTVAITAKPANPTATAATSFSFTASEGTPQCKLDAGVFTACTSPISYGALADGSHTFTVRSVDALGNTGSATWTWTIDTTAPMVTITSKPTNPTNLLPAVFAFTASEGTPQCKLDGAAFTACTSPISYPGLADGSHTFTVRSADALGNTGSDTWTWTIDTVGPAVAITSPPANPTPNNMPPIGFTVSADAVTITCKLDALTAQPCTPPTYTPPVLADGSHTVLITALDGLGNVGTASTTFTVDATGPVVTFDAVPPANWPVNYFDVLFHANEAATFECSLNGGAFAACASGDAVTTTYGVLSSYAVRAKDTLGTMGGTVTTTWTSSAGLVLHYPWELGATHNTSLLAQVPAYSPNSTATLNPIGGWAGAAASSPAAHTYPRTSRPLSSSATGGYTGSVWLRVNADNALGVLWSTGTAAGGHRVKLSSTTVSLDVFEGANTYTVTASVPLNRWANVAVRTLGPTKGLQLLIDGNVIATAPAPNATGFGAGQAANLTVGRVDFADVDDLRFYNVALVGNAACTTLVRGEFDLQGLCVPLRQLFELDFEGNRIINTGTMPLSVTSPSLFAFIGTKLGAGISVGPGQLGLSLGNFIQSLTPQPGHSLSFWFDGSGPPDTLLDFTTPCSFVANFGTCGISVTMDDLHQLTVFTGTSAVKKTTVIPAGGVTPRLHSFVLTEKRSGNITDGVLLYIDGQLSASVGIGTGDLFQVVNNTVRLAGLPGSTVDEYEMWPRDLSADPEMLCENGFDGEFDLVTGTCSLTAN